MKQEETLKGKLIWLLIWIIVSVFWAVINTLPVYHPSTLIPVLGFMICGYGIFFKVDQ